MFLGQISLWFKSTKVILAQCADWRIYKGLIQNPVKSVGVFLVASVDIWSGYKSLCCCCSLLSLHTVDIWSCLMFTNKIIIFCVSKMNLDFISMLSGKPRWFIDWRLWILAEVFSKGDRTCRKSLWRMRRIYAYNAFGSLQEHKYNSGKESLDL